MGPHFTSHSRVQLWRWEFSHHAPRKQRTRPECLKSKIATIFAMNKRVHREPITLPLSVDEEIDGRCQRPPEFPGCAGLVQRLVRESTIYAGFPRFWPFSAPPNRLRGKSARGRAAREDAMYFMESRQRVEPIVRTAKKFHSQVLPLSGEKA